MRDQTQPVATHMLNACTRMHTHHTPTLYQSPSSAYQLRSLCNQSLSPIHTGAKGIITTQDDGQPASATVIPFTQYLQIQQGQASRGRLAGSSVFLSIFIPKTVPGVLTCLSFEAHWLGTLLSTYAFLLVPWGLRLQSMSCLQLSSPSAPWAPAVTDSSAPLSTLSLYSQLEPAMFPWGQTNSPKSPTTHPPPSLQTPSSAYIWSCYERVTLLPTHPPIFYLLSSTQSAESVAPLSQVLGAGNSVMNKQVSMPLGIYIL